MNTLNIQFSINGSVEQTIEFYMVAPQDFIEGLKTGKYITSIGFGDNNGRVYQLEGFKEIGRVMSQSSLDDTEFEDYQDIENN